MFRHDGRVPRTSQPLHRRILGMNKYNEDCKLPSYIKPVLHLWESATGKKIRNHFRPAPAARENGFTSGVRYGATVWQMWNVDRGSERTAPRMQREDDASQGADIAGTARKRGLVLDVIAAVDMGGGRN